MDIFHAYCHISTQINMVRETDTKNRTEYFFDDIISIKNFDPNNIKRDKKNVKKIFSFTESVLCHQTV